MTSPTVGRLVDRKIGQNLEKKTESALTYQGSPESVPQPPPGQCGSLDLRPRAPKETRPSEPEPYAATPGWLITDPTLSEEGARELLDAHRYAGSRPSSKIPGCSVGAGRTQGGAGAALAVA